MKMQIIQRFRRWTDDERDIIKNNYLELSDEEIGMLIDRSASAVKGERQKLNLFRPRSSNKIRRKNEKMTFEQIQRTCNEKHYILLSDEKDYVNKSSKIKYICEKHREKGEQLISVHHLNEGKGCYYCGRERTNQSHKSKVAPEEDKKLCELKGFDYIKTQIENNIPYIYFICKKHKILGVQKMRRDNMNRECVKGCQYCSYKNLPHWYVKYIIEFNYSIEVLSEYDGMNKPITCRCLIHDEIFTTLAKYVFHNGTGCSMCTKEKLSKKSRLTLDEVKTRILARNPDVEILNLDSYVGWETKMKLKCKKCGFVWQSPFCSIINNTGRCPGCQSGSYGEQIISSILLDKAIYFVPQYKFADCRGEKNPLPFDFAILDNNDNVLGLIEYNGEQHYYPVEYFGGKEKFDKQVKRDNIKRNYCETNDIPLLIIPYWDFDRIEYLVTDFIDNL